LVVDRDTREEIARHKLSDLKGQRIINLNHYRNYEDTAAELKIKCLEEFKPYPNSDKMLEKLILNNPKIVRDQLRGILQIHKRNKAQDWHKIVEICLSLNDLKVSLISDLVEKMKKQKQIEEVKSIYNSAKMIHAKPHTSVLDRPLTKYNEVVS